jgi:simple sugar transport system ATP-binding protein
VVLEVQGLAVRGNLRQRAVDGVSLQLRAGEILGIAGVEGNGQTELIEALAGLRHAHSGSMRLHGADLGGGVAGRIASGISHIPEDRRRRGLVLGLTVEDNLILGRQARFTRRGLLDRPRIRAHAAGLVARWDVRPDDPTLPAAALSGGNQQKVVVARELDGEVRLLLAAQPTRGVDLGAVARIHQGILAARDAGAAVLLVSADLAEVLALSDRVAVMYRGRIAVERTRAEASEAALGPAMTGAAEVA